MPQNFSAKKFVIQTFLTFTLEEVLALLSVFFLQVTYRCHEFASSFWQTISPLTSSCKGKYCVNFCARYVAEVKDGF